MPQPQNGPGGTERAKGTATTGNQPSSSGIQNTPRAEQGRGLARPYEPATLSPFTMMRRMMEDMERVFEGGVFAPFGGLARLGSQDPGTRLPRGVWAPRIDVREHNGKLVVHADLPGLKGEDIDVRVENDVLTICGERKEEHEEEQGNVYASERSYGRFERSIALPPGIDPNAVEAKFDNGVLELSAPLPENRKARRIDIKGSTATTPSGGATSAGSKPAGNKTSS
jgi:HSP20 family protein